MAKPQRTQSQSSETFYTFEKKWPLDLSKEGLAEPTETPPEILYCHIYKDILAIQARWGSRNELFMQSFPPTQELRPFQKSLKEDAEVALADDQMTFVYFPHKTSLDILQNDSKIASVKGKLKHQKVLKCGDREAYLLAINNKMIEVTINVVTSVAEEVVLDLAYTSIRDFTYYNGKLYVIGFDEKSQQTSISRHSPDTFPHFFSLPLVGQKLKFVKVVDEDYFVVHDGKQIYYLSAQSPKELKVQKQILIPLTISSVLMKIEILEDKRILMQDAEKHIYIFGQEDPTKELLLKENPVVGALLMHGKSIYLVEPEKELLQFSELQKIGLPEYMKTFGTFAELKPMKGLWLSSTETQDLFYKAYVKDNLDQIVNLQRSMKKIKSIQIKLRLMQELTPHRYQKLEEYIELLQAEVEQSEMGPAKTAHLKAIKEYRSQISLYMTLANSQYSQSDFIKHKQKTVLDLINEHIANEVNIGLICSAYVNEAMLHYEKILEKIIEFEIEETPRGEGECCIEKLLPLGKNYNNILLGYTDEKIGSFVGYWEGVRQRMGEEEFMNYSRDYTNYFKAIKFCFTKARRSKYLLKYLCVIVECGTRRGIEKLDLLRFDFRLRDSINLPPSERYNIDQASNVCSDDTFVAFITRRGSDHVSLLKGMRDFYGEMVKYIESKAVATKEFFKLLERYMLRVEIKILCGIISEINESRSRSKELDQYAFINENKSYIFEIALKHIYTQENASHAGDVGDLYRLLLSFLGESQPQYKNLLSILANHIEIAEIFKKYGLHNHMFKEICKLSNLEKWQYYVETVSSLINEKIPLDQSGQLLISMQEKVINYYASTIAKTTTIFTRDSWKGCLQDVQKLHVTSCQYQAKYRKYARVKDPIHIWSKSSLAHCLKTAVSL